MGTFILFLIVWAAVEAVIMLLSYYDNFGENWGWSLAFTVALFALIGAIVNSNNDAGIELTEQSQTSQLDEQWVENAIDDITGIDPGDNTPLLTEDDVVNAIKAGHSETNTINDIELKFPSMRAHLDSNRRNYDTTVTYRPDARLGCIGNACVKVRLIQHTDGTFWACKRNYGTCYHYKMANE